MIVTIDGPAGAGKSSAARELAARLGFRFLDTGAMYRAVALAAIERLGDYDDPKLVADLARRLRIELVGAQVLLDGRDVTREIRASHITSITHIAADNAEVRRYLVELQRRAAEGHDVVTEGRDQGTVVFPQAECKIFLTASREERARRRLADLLAKNEPVTYEDVLATQTQRDHRDAVRTVGPLRAAPDAIEVSTDGLSPREVVDRLEAIVRSKMQWSC